MARLLPFNTISPLYPLKPAVLEVEPTDRAPPEHEPNFAERYFGVVGFDSHVPAKTQNA